MKFFSIFLILYIFQNTLSAITLDTDTFNSNTDGWSGSNVWQESGKLRIDRDDTAQKTFTLTGYQNQTVTFTLEATEIGSWENNDDLEIRVNGNLVVNDTINNTETKTFNVTLNSNAQTTITIKPNTNNNNEDIYIDNITVIYDLPSCSSLRESYNLTNVNTSYTNYSHYNDGNWNVGPGSSGGTLGRAYYFNVDGAGSVDIDLSMIDNDQARFSVSKASCPTTKNDLTSSQLIFTQAGDFYVYIYYVNGSNTNIEHRLDVIFTPDAPPVMQNIPDQYATVGTYFELDISSYVTMTNSDEILNYSLTGDLPSWLSFNSTTGILSGTPSAEAEAVGFSVTATDNDGESNSDSFSVTVSPPQTESFGGRDFSQRTQSSLFGDVKVIGNTVLCILNNGVCVEPTNTNSNTDTNLQKAPSSYSTLTLPANATVEYARIYWQGRKAATYGNEAWDADSKTAAGKIKLRKGDSGEFTELNADIKDFDSTESRNYIRVYSASADASSVVNGSGIYYIDTDSFYTETGEMDNKNPDDGLGAYGAWVLVVIYKDPDDTKARNITIFDGYKKVTDSSGNIDITLSGFLTPKNGEVDSKTYVFAAEGDKYLEHTGDVIKMGGATYNTTLQTLGTFDSRVDVTGTRSPNLINNNGIDIHKYDTGTTSGARNIITTNETGAAFRFTSDQDTYFPSLIVFSTQLYLPQMCYDYSIKQDGHYLDVNRDAYPIAHLDSAISSSELEIVIYLKNKEADIAAQGIAIKADVNDTRFDQVGNIYTSNVNGSTLIDRGTPSFSSTLCDYDKNGDNSADNAGCTNGHDIRKGNGSLDADDYIYTKYKLQPKNISSLENVDEPLGLSLKYYIVAGGAKIEYPDYLLGSDNVPLCPPTGSYQPAWGNFNIVQSGQSNDNIKNNLYTQISRKPFDVAVVFDSSPESGNNEAPTSDVNTTVLAEIIDVDAFGDINASCTNPDSTVSQSIFVPINFTNSGFQTDITPQNADYYNFAIKNAAFRIWYFNNNDGTLIQNWSASTTNSNKTLVAISNLYNADTHPLCTSSCSTPTSAECFTCIKDNYAQALCSRDNFSIRPESYDLRVYDINQSLPSYNLNDDPSNIKNTSKVDLSDQYGYSPSHAFTTGRIKLAAGYAYRFDVTSTGHDGISSVPRYTRYFNGADDYNATMLWDPQSVKTGCNDTNDKNLAFYVANGVMQNEEKINRQVGEYRFNIIDRSWTAVDWQYLSHHDTSGEGGFLSGEDCITNSSSSTAVNSKYGCVISTDHGSDGNGNTYKDIDTEYLPYKFDMSSVVPSHGENNDTFFDSGTYIYMSDISQSEEMSFHINGAVSALGYDGAALSNFVEGCYAKPIDLTLNKSAITGSINYEYIFHNADVAANDQNSTMNNISGTITLGTNDFNRSNNGTLNTILNLNFERSVTAFANPQEISFISYDANCSTPSDCTMNADLGTKTTQGRLNLNQTIKHYYGRTHASRQRYEGATGRANIFYEVYCFATDIFGQTCNKSLLQNGSSSKRVDDIRWFINENHTSNNGNAGTVREKDSLGHVNVAGSTNGNHPDDSTLMTYDESRGYPYKTTMENNASIWLIYNENDPTATRNSFSAEFENSSNWSGYHETNTTTNDVGAVRTNRRSTW